MTSVLDSDDNEPVGVFSVRTIAYVVISFCH